MAFNCMQMSIFLMERKVKRQKTNWKEVYVFKKMTARLISLIQRKLLKVDFFLNAKTKNRQFIEDEILMTNKR